MMNVASIPLTITSILVAVVAFASIPFVGDKLANYANRSISRKIALFVALWLLSGGYGVLVSFAIGFPIKSGLIGGTVAVVWLMLQISGHKRKERDAKG